MPRQTPPPTGTLEAFEATLTLPELPSTVEVIEAALKTQLDPQCHILQWAIVHADPDTLRVKIEGACIQPA